MPDLIGVFGHRNANVFLGRIDVIEKAEIDRSRVLGKDGEVDAVARARSRRADKDNRAKFLPVS